MTSLRRILERSRYLEQAMHNLASQIDSCGLDRLLDHKVREFVQTHLGQPACIKDLGSVLAHLCGVPCQQTLLDDIAGELMLAQIAEVPLEAPNNGVPIFLVSFLYNILDNIVPIGFPADSD